jgi:hypothetical protein
MGIEPILSEEILSNGKAIISITAEPTDLINEGVLDDACPNDNWHAMDALPLTNTDAYFEEIIIVGSSCYIRSTLLYNNCEILGGIDSVEWDTTVNDFKPVPYKCLAPLQTNYSKNLILYSTWYGDNCPPGICFSDTQCSEGQTCVSNVCTTPSTP